MKESHNGLTAGQLAMMALGTVVGGSFFLGSSVAIRAAGPAVVISYILGGILVYFILFALSEMTVVDAAPGSFRTFAEKAYGPGVGFVVGWVYWTGIALAMSSEATAVSIFLKGWIPNISLPLIGSIIIIIVTLLNLLGADKLSKLESGLATIKLLAIVGFIVLGIMLIFDIGLDAPKIGMGALQQESWFPGGILGIAGSMLIVMFTYAGFEIIGLAASETSNPHKTVPKAIAYTVIILVGLYVAAIMVLLPLIPINQFTEEKSPMVLALTRWNLGWAGGAMNVVLITAILSTMLAAMFGLGRMIRSLADEGHAPLWLKDKGDIPYRGIIFSGIAMLLGLFFGFVLPEKVYIFLVSSGGFALLFTYLVILVTHHKFRKKNGCPPNGKCQLPGYPFSSWMAILSLMGIILSMPLVEGQGYGLVAGVTLVLLYTALYFVKKYFSQNLKEGSYKDKVPKSIKPVRTFDPKVHMETSEELVPDKLKGEEKKKK
ncbi:amino acid permease [Crassaminicella profunda]|uniref:amino acid permease n=1 Tax=Crassaminicella profunda TaxID=1286698 RepID=UPI001CA71942|nr:amino acid permease [Crassaminicella profunda]QZY56444.1 amino acid permease [Crassaminicella profunda]